MRHLNVLLLLIVLFVVAFAGSFVGPFAGLLVAHVAAAEDEVFSGSGYGKAEGTVFNYTYNNFGGFYVEIKDHALNWEGFHGYFLGIARATKPQISEVAPDVFFYSWRTRGNGSDNVVQNYNSMRVSAHLQPDDGAGAAIQMIHGVVHCRDTPECRRPRSDLTPAPAVASTIAKNAKEFGLPRLFDPEINNTPKTSADIAGRDALRDKTIVYHTPEGEYRVQVRDDTTLVGIAGQKPVAFQTYATELMEDLYFVSWMGGVGGNHIVVNTRTKKVFDHILPSGERRESVFALTCFGSLLGTTKLTVGPI